MKTLAALVCLFLLVPLLPSSAGADEPTLLERLSDEVARATDAADRATVPVVGGLGVLVGTPPRLVVPWSVAQEHAALLRDDSSGVSFRRIDGDEELGIAVYEPPAGDRWPTLPLAADWNARRGDLVVAAGEEPRLAMLARVDPVRGHLTAEVPQDCRILLDGRGRLLGLRAAPAWIYPYWFNVGTNPYTYHYYYASGVGGSGGGKGAVTTDFAGRWRLLDPRSGAATIQLGELATYRLPGGVTGPDGLLVHQATTLPHISYGYALPQPPTFVPGPIVARVLADVQEHGHIRHAYLGVVPTEETGADGVARTRLTAVFAGSPAAAAGLREGDVLARVDETRDPDLATFTRVLLLHRPGEALRLRVARLGTEELVVTLAERTEAVKALRTPADLGLHFLGLTPDLAAWLGLDDGRAGVVVDRVAPGSLADTAGLQRGDVIVAADGRPVRDLAELEATLASAVGPLSLRVARGPTKGGQGEVELTIELPAATSTASPR